jgi:uncharacterized protein YdeI (YjbR/CyaY-like superfamily)
VRYTPRSRRQWRDWLAKNHADKDEVWLVYYKKHTGKPTLSYNDSVEEALCFGWIDGILKRVDDERYMHRFTPRKPGSNWSETNVKRVERLLEAGLMTESGFKCVEEAKLSGRWDAAAGPAVELSMPEELEKALAHQKMAAAFFETLAPSYRREFIAWIATAKRPETRKKRLQETVALLEQRKKLGMR